MLVDPQTRRLKGTVFVLKDFKQMRVLSHPIRWNIMKVLCESPLYPKELAKKLGIAEQLAYYHINHLKRSGLIKEVSKTRIRGGEASFYAPTADGIAVLFSEKEKAEALELGFLPFFLYDVIRYSHRIVLTLSSPEPHGPFMSRGRDHHLMGELLIRIGHVIDDPLKFEVKLDTMLTDSDLEESSLIILGGPLTNVISYKVNRKLPIHFDTYKGNIIVSTLSGKRYYEDECGIVEVVKNPYNPKLYLVLVAGKTLEGTRAAMKALLKKPAEISRGNFFQEDVIAHVVEGVDEDGDGIIDNAIILE